MGSSYQIEGTTQAKDRVRITTDDRDRAVQYAAKLLAGGQYASVSVETDGRIWIGEMIGRMP